MILTPEIHTVLENLRETIICEISFLTLIQFFGVCTEPAETKIRNYTYFQKVIPSAGLYPSSTSIRPEYKCNYQHVTQHFLECNHLGGMVYIMSKSAHEWPLTLHLCKLKPVQRDWKLNLITMSRMTRSLLGYKLQLPNLY